MSETISSNNPSFASYGKNFQEKIVHALLVDHAFAEQMMEVIKGSYFDQKYLQFLAERYFRYAEKYKVFPTLQLMATICRDELKQGSDKLLAEQIVDYLVRLKSNPDTGDLPFVKDKSLDFARKAALKEAMEKSIDLMENEKYDSIVDIMKKATIVGTTPSLGHDFFTDIEARFQPQIRNAIPTMIPELDHREILNGGLGSGELGVVVAGTGVGKCAFYDTKIKIKYNKIKIDGVLYDPWDLVNTKRGQVYAKDILESDILIDLNIEQLKCQICGYTGSKKITGLKTHIIRAHSKSYGEYKKDFFYLFPSKKKIIYQMDKKRFDDNFKRINQMLLDGDEELKCEICGFKTTYSLISHIISKHTDMQSYRKLYPNSIVQRSSSITKEKNRILSRESSKKIWSENYEQELAKRAPPSTTQHWINKGFSLEEAKIKVSEFQREQSLKGNNERTRALRSKNASGDNNPMSLASIAKKYNISLEDASKLTPCYNRCGEKHPMFGKHHTEEALQKISSAPHLSNPDYRSIPEIEVEQFCISLGELENNKSIHKWNVDICFKNKNLIVEFFGDFWHANPQKFSKDWINPVTKKSSTFSWERDERKIKELNEWGYEVVVIWEHDWNTDKDSCLKRIQDAYNRIS